MSIASKDDLWKIEASVKTWEPPVLKSRRDPVIVLTPRPEPFTDPAGGFVLRAVKGPGYVVYLTWVLFDRILAASIRFVPDVLELKALLSGNPYEAIHERLNNAYGAMVYYMSLVMRAASKGEGAPAPPPGVGIVNDDDAFPYPAVFDVPYLYTYSEPPPRAINVSIVDYDTPLPEAR